MVAVNTRVSQHSTGRRDGLLAEAYTVNKVFTSASSEFTVGLATTGKASFLSAEVHAQSDVALTQRLLHTQHLSDLLHAATAPFQPQKPQLPLYSSSFRFSSFLYQPTLNFNPRNPFQKTTEEAQISFFIYSFQSMRRMNLLLHAHLDTLKLLVQCFCWFNSFSRPYTHTHTHLQATYGLFDQEWVKRCVPNRALVHFKMIQFSALKVWSSSWIIAPGFSS